MAFNLHQYEMQKKAIALPNGQTTINLPNGGEQTQLTNSDGSPLQGNSSENTQLKDIIGDILYESSMGDRDPESIKNMATEIISADMPPEFSGKDDLMRMVAALGRRAGEDPNKISTNPETGEKEQSLEDLASSIAKMAGWDIEALINEASTRKETENEEPSTDMGVIPEQSTGVPPVRISKKNTPVETTKDENFKEKAKEDPASKRKKGNPFKVLMGLVGKMLDHGMERREIVKKVTRQEGNKWKPETIEKCIKVVRNSRKKEHKQKDEEKTAMSNKFNLYKYSQKKNVSKENNEKIKDFEGRKSIYDIPRNIKLMSTMELISRLAYLNGAVGFEFSGCNENNPGGKELKTSQFTKDLKAVKSELSRRNYNDEQISILSRTVQGIQSED